MCRCEFGLPLTPTMLSSSCSGSAQYDMDPQPVEVSWSWRGPPFRPGAGATGRLLPPCLAAFPAGLARGGFAAAGAAPGAVLAAAACAAGGLGRLAGRGSSTGATRLRVAAGCASGCDVPPVGACGMLLAAVDAAGVLTGAGGLKAGWEVVGAMGKGMGASLRLGAAALPLGAGLAGCAEAGRLGCAAAGGEAGAACSTSAQSERCRRKKAGNVEFLP